LAKNIIYQQSNGELPTTTVRSYAAIEFLDLVRPISLRHAVWTAEKFGCVVLKIAGNSRNSSDVAIKPH
jgi:hypothetical protein